MNEYNQKYNKDDVFTRSMIVCLLAELNKKMYIYNRLDDGSVQRVNIPCLYSITGGNSERFLKDEFYYDSLEQGKAYGDYESVPRCMVNLSSFSVNSAEQTNKYNRTKIVRESKGILRTLYLNVEWIPITLSFECKVICSNAIEIFKSVECIISKIYKNPNYFKVDYGMFNVDACITSPTDYNNEITQEFGLNEKKEFSTSFSIEMKTLMPAFEHGLLMCEIDELLLDLPKEAKGIVEYRPDEFGVFGMRAGGMMEEIDDTTHVAETNEPEIKSNIQDCIIVYEDIKQRGSKDEIIARGKVTERKQ